MDQQDKYQSPIRICLVFIMLPSVDTHVVNVQEKLITTGPVVDRLFVLVTGGEGP